MAAAAAGGDGARAAKRARTGGDEALGGATLAVHADSLGGGAAEFSTAGDIAPPLSLSTTFATGDAGDGAGHVYSRISAPTRSRCEALVAAVEGAGADGAPAEAVLYSSGLSACFAVLSHLLPPRVAISGGYHGTHLVLQQLRRLSGGQKFQVVPLPEPGDVAGTLAEGDVLWLETPVNPSCAVRDIAAYVAAARGAQRVVVDGTFAPPPLQRPLALGADFVVHATTKYFAGHSDALGGVVCTAAPEAAAALRRDRIALGSTPGSMEVWLLVRSIRTLHLRAQRQSETAARLAAWLHGGTGAGGAAHPLAGLVHAVHHASLPSSPCHEVARRQMPGGFGGCLAVELVTEDAARALPGQLRLFKDATSLGGVESLIEWRRKYDDAVSPLLLRVSIGLEDYEDLRADLQRGILAASRRA